MYYECSLAPKFEKQLETKVSDQRGNNLAKLGDGVLEPVNSSESNILNKATV